MKIRFKEIWNDPVWSKIIATGILALLATVYGVAAKYFRGGLSLVSSKRYLNV